MPNPTAPARRSFLFYSGASVALGSLWLASCTKEEDAVPASTPAPTISSFAPGSGMAGATITLTGTNFNGATAAQIGGVAAPFTVVSATSLTLTVPATAATGSITITTPGGTATSTTAFTVLPPASTITSFTPSSALAGATVTLTGTNFSGATSVTVAGVATTFAVVNATTITLTIPATAQTGLFIVTTPSGTGTSSTPFTVLPQFINVGAGDVGVLNYAYALEQLEAAFYARVKATPPTDFSVAEQNSFSQLAAHEAIHRDFFRLVLNRDAPGKIIPDLTPLFDAIDFTKRASVLSAARTFEDLGVAAYNGAAKFLSNAAYLVLLGKIVSVEARHAAYVRDLITPNSFASSDIVDDVYGLDSAKNPSEVAPLVNAFLAAGSKLDVSGLA